MRAKVPLAIAALVIGGVVLARGSQIRDPARAFGFSAPPPLEPRPALSQARLDAIAGNVYPHILARTAEVEALKAQTEKEIEGFDAKIKRWASEPEGGIYVRRYQASVDGLRQRLPYLLQQKNALDDLCDEIRAKHYKIRVVQLRDHRVVVEVVDNAMRINASDERWPDDRAYEAAAHNVVLGLTPAVLARGDMPVDGIILRGQPLVDDPISGETQTAHTYQFEVSSDKAALVKDWNKANVNALIEQVLRPSVWRF